MSYRKLIACIALMSPLTFPMQVHSGEVADALVRYAGNVHQFSSIFPQEKVFIQFDNTAYYAGETIWFKAYVVNAADNHRAESKVLYVDLLSPGGVVLKQQKLKIVAGQCDGSFPLLDASTSQARELRGVLPYPSGFYEVRAYTMNMLNFNQEAIFSRVLPVYEKPKKEGGYYDEKPYMKLHKETVEQYRPKTSEDAELNAGFFPEGGRMVVGKTNRVAFKVWGSDGTGIDAEVRPEGMNETIRTEHDGMGVFEFTPTGRNNSVTVTANGRTRRFSLPNADNEGYALRADKKDNTLEVEISGTEGMTADTLGLAVTCRDGLAYFSCISQENHHAMVSVPLDFNEGVCRLVLFDRNGNILASRYFYNHSDQPAPVLDFEPDQESYRPFDKIKLDFTLKDGAGNPFRDRFCLSVRDSRGSGNMSSGDLRSTLLLSSDLKGFVNNPDWYFESDDEEHSHALDLLTMVQGWERYEWDTMSGQKEFKELHRRENGLTINGWILSPSGNKPLADVKVMAALVPPDKTQTEKFDCITDSTGYFGLDISDFYDIARLTIHTTESRKRKIVGTSSRILFERSMTPGPRPYFVPETTLRNIIANNRKVAGKPQEEAYDDNMPEIIWDNIGYLLPDVEINDRRKYIDFHTFKAFNVGQDVEMELDKAEFSGDVLGYLMDKGYELSVAADSNGLGNILLDISGSDEDVAFQLADTSKLNGINTFWYVHNKERCLYQGIFCPPWAIDTKDVNSLMIYDRVMPLTSVMTLTPLFTEGFKHHVDVVSQSNIVENTDPLVPTRNYYLVDLEVKDDYYLSSRKELMEIGKRVTTFTGYSSPYQFFSPEYPDGPIVGDVDYRRTIYWEPNVVTDAQGHASIEFYNNSQSSSFCVSGTGLTASGQPYVLESGF